MKSKNMTLMVIAIGCGLVAAFLTAKLSGGNNPDKVEVVVAKKELPVGTILDEKDMETNLATLKFERNTLPPDVILSADELKGKRLSRTLKQGNYFQLTDVATDSGIKGPEGASKYSIKIDGVKAVSGFVNPGDKVDVILTETTAAGRARSGFVLRDMLVLAVDQTYLRREGNQAAVLQVNSVTLAVTPKESLALSSAERRGEVKLLLRDPKNPDKAHVAALSFIESIDGKDQTAPQLVAKRATIIVAKIEVPANTKVTAENYDEYFITKDVPEESAPNTIVRDPAMIKGKYVISKLMPDLPVYEFWLSDKSAEPPAPPVVVMADPPPAPELETLPFPREVVPLYPRKFEQIINYDHYYFIEISPGVFRRTDGQGIDLKQLPDSNAKPVPKEQKADETTNDRPV